MPFDDESTTQEVDVDSPDSQITSDEDGGQRKPDWFLDVDERHRYRSADDAAKAIRESGERISQLSAWEKEIQADYPGATPQQVRAALREYVTLRQEREKAAKEPPQKPSGSDTTSSEQLTPEEQKALDWLQKHAPRLGFVPKSDLEETKKQMKEMNEALQELRGGSEQQFEAHRDSLIEQGRAQLDEMLTSAGLPTDNKQLKLVVEGAIRDWINSDDELVKRFYKGGVVTQKLIEEGFQNVTSALGLVKAKQATNYARTKNNVASRTSRPLPKPGQAQRPTTPPQGRQKSGITPSVHDKAFALANSIWDGGSE